MPFKVGHIYHFKPCRASNPTKDKYAICMSAEYSWFYLINSCSDVPPKRPYEHEKGLTVILQPYQISPMTKKSYINVNRIVSITSDDYDEYREYNQVSNMIWLTIKALCIAKRPKDITNKIYGTQI